MGGASATAAAQLAENGRVLATLDDWRAIVFVLVGVIVILILFCIWILFAGARREDRQAKTATDREKTAADREERLAAAIDKVGDALDAMRTEIAVLRALTSRVESQHDRH